jgi:hypothetical protein
MARQVKPAHLLDFSRQHHVMLSGWCLQPKAGTNQATAATAAVAASASAAYAFVAPAFTIAVSVPATVAPATVSATSPLLLQGAVAAFASATAPLPLSSCWQMPQLLLYHCHACWQMQNSFCSVTVMAAGRCKTAFASLSMPLSLVFMAHLHIAPPIAIGLTCCLCHGGTQGSISDHWPALLFCGDLNCGMNHGTPGTSAYCFHVPPWFCIVSAFCSA